MTIRIVAISTMISLMLTACQNNNGSTNLDNRNSESAEVKSETKVEDIDFVLLENYFIKNNVSNSVNPKIETLEKFNEIFGMATTMGNDGKPTGIDFQKQYVIAMVLPETDLMTTIRPIRLQRNEIGGITLLYKTTVGQTQSFTTRPFLAIIVDKAEDGNIELKELK